MGLGPLSLLLQKTGDIWDPRDHVSGKDFYFGLQRSNEADDDLVVAPDRLALQQILDPRQRTLTSRGESGD